MLHFFLKLFPYLFFSYIFSMNPHGPIEFPIVIKNIVQDPSIQQKALCSAQSALRHLEITHKRSFRYIVNSKDTAQLEILVEQKTPHEPFIVSIITPNSITRNIYPLLCHKFNERQRLSADQYADFCHLVQTFPSNPQNRAIMNRYFTSQEQQHIAYLHRMYEILRHQEITCTNNGIIINHTHWLSIKNKETQKVYNSQIWSQSCS